MYANVTHTKIDNARWTEIPRAFDDRQESLLTQPGFRGAYWMAPLEGYGLVVSLWEDERSAMAAVQPVGFAPAPGVTVERVDTREVIGLA